MSLKIDDPLLAEFLHRPVISQLWNNAEKLADSLPFLVGIAARFASSNSLIPADCDQAVQRVRALNEPASRLEPLLKQPEILPSTLVDQRFELLASLGFIETKLQEAAMEIGDYRLICLEWTPRAAQQRLAIQDQVEMLTQAVEEVSSQILISLESLPSTPARRYSQ